MKNLRLSPMEVVYLTWTSEVILTKPLISWKTWRGRSETRQRRQSANVPDLTLTRWVSTTRLLSKMSSIPTSCHQPQHSQVWEMAKYRFWNQSMLFKDTLCPLVGLKDQSVNWFLRIQDLSSLITVKREKVQQIRVNTQLDFHHLISILSSMNPLLDQLPNSMKILI